MAASFLFKRIKQGWRARFLNLHLFWLGIGVVGVGSMDTEQWHCKGPWLPGLFWISTSVADFNQDSCCQPVTPVCRTRPQGCSGKQLWPQFQGSVTFSMLSCRLRRPSRGQLVVLQACQEDYILSQKFCSDFGFSSLQQKGWLQSHILSFRDMCLLLHLEVGLVLFSGLQKHWARSAS